jgi:hypothetical protein
MSNREVLHFVQDLVRAAERAHESEYKEGYLAACADVEEFVEDQMWEEGEDDEDRS